MWESALVLLAVSTYVVEACRLVLTVGGAIIVTAILVWGFVEDESWPLRSAIRLTSAAALLLVIIAVLAVFIATRK